MDEKISTAEFLGQEAPRWDTARKEIDAAPTTSAKRDTTDAFGLAGVYYPQLSDDAVAELCLSIQWMDEARSLLEQDALSGMEKRKVTRELSRRARHEEYLLGSVFRLARKVVSETIEAAGPSKRGMMEDLMQEAAIIGMETARSFDVASGAAYPTWFTSRLKARTGSLLFGMESKGSVTASWRKASRIIASIEKKMLAESGRSATDAEMEEMFVDAIRTWAEEAGAVTEEEIQAKIVKSGLAAASRELPQIRLLVGTEVSLDSTRDEDEDSAAATLGAIDFGFDEVDERHDSQIEFVTESLISMQDIDIQDAIRDRLENGPKRGPEGKAGKFVRELNGYVSSPAVMWYMLNTSPSQFTYTDARTAVGDTGATV